MEAHEIDGFSIFGLVVFATAVFCVVCPLRLPLPQRPSISLWRYASYFRLINKPDDRRLHLHFNLVTTPLLGVLLLLITTAIDGSVIKYGIVGQDNGRPYDVLILFISLAYIATALDATGALRFLALSVSQRGGGNGYVLYATLYVFFFSAAIIIGNDPIILSGTAFLAYFTRATGIVPPTAWTYAEFLTANTASAVLVSSNPTNILIAGAFDLNYITGYTKFTILPSLLAALLGFPLLFAIFTICRPSQVGHHSPPSTPLAERPGTRETRAYIPKQLFPPDINARSALVDPWGALFHVVLLLVTLSVLVGTSFVQTNPPQVWMITAPAGIVALLHDLIVDYLHQSSQFVSPGNPDQTEDTGIKREAEKPAAATSQVVVKPHTEPSYPPRVESFVTLSRRMTVISLWQMFAKRFPGSAQTLRHLPFALLPFAVGMFILVQALEYLGWVAVFARWLAIAAPTPASAAFIVGPLTAFVLCVIAGTNIGATVLMVAVIRHPSYSAVVTKQTLQAAIFSLALGSNLGAFGWAFSASLAGLLWARILRQKGIVVRQIEFAAWNAIPLVTLTMVSCGLVVAEVNWFAQI